jgi:hypothetical protein
MMEHFLAKMGAEMKAQIGSLVSRVEVKLEKINVSKKEVIVDMKVWHEEIKA